MRTNYVLIDFESIQPDLSHCLVHEHLRVLVFVGANQAKLSFETASVLQKMGPRAEYIKISGSGKNALDFHVAYYIGQFAAVDPSAYFHIISRDSGFDPLIHHLKDKKIHAGRVSSISEIPVIKNANAKSPGERLRLVIERLMQLKGSKPRTVKTLSSTIASLFQKKIADAEVATLVEELTQRGLIAISGTKIAYKLEG